MYREEYPRPQLVRDRYIIECAHRCQLAPVVITERITGQRIRQRVNAHRRKKPLLLWADAFDRPDCIC